MTALLAFDTSTEHMSIALSVNDRVCAYEAAGGMLASGQLIPEIMKLLRDAQITLQELDAIAFGCGPGAFTGLRTACSVAQGLALGANKPVLPIDTLLAVAEDARGSRAELGVWVVMDARMGEIYAAHYRYGDGRWHTLSVPQLCTLEALHRQWQEEPPACLAGNALLAFAGPLWSGTAELFPNALPRASAMLTVAHDLWAQGCAVDAASALPIYLRDKVAQTTVERAASRAARGLDGLTS